MLTETLEMKTLKIETLKQKLEKAEKRYNEIEYEIEDLQAGLDDAESECDELETQIKEIEQEIRSEKIFTLMKSDTSSELQFVKDFYHAALFCNHFDEVRPVLMNVNVTDKSLQGCNGFMAIEIKSDDIPEHLKNKLVPWDTDLLENPKFGEGQYLDIDKVFSEFFGTKPDSKVLSKLDIENLMLKELSEKTGKEICKFKLGSKMFGMNPKYITNALKCLPDDGITVYWEEPIAPVAFVTEKLKAMVLPIRL